MARSPCITDRRAAFSNRTIPAANGVRADCTVTVRPLPRWAIGRHYCYAFCPLSAIFSLPPIGPSSGGAPFSPAGEKSLNTTRAGPRYFQHFF